MSQIVRNATIDPKSLMPVALEALVDSLYAVHCDIFDGVSREEFARYVVNSPADKTRIQVSYGEGGDLAGYIAVHAFRRSVRDEPCTVVRAEAGLRRPYRGNGSPASFMVSQVLKMQWDYPGLLYYLGCLVHPSSYSAFARDAAAIFPAHDAETPEALFELMLQLGEEFHLPIVDARRPLVRQVGWITRDTEVERRYWQTTDLPAPRFYIAQNPGYCQGHGLLTLVPLDGASLAKSLMKWGGTRLKKSVQRTIGSLERAVLRPKLGTQMAESLLAKLEEQTGLPIDAMRAQGVRGTRFPIAARTVLFRAGDRADAMYVVIAGSVFVLEQDAEGEETVIDQLGPNSMVGEMGLMTGQPRTATVRAAVDSLLLRLTPQDVAAIHAAVPLLVEELWLRICARVFQLQLRLVPALAQLPRDVQEAWYAAGRAHHLAEGAQLVLDAACVLVLAMGKLLIADAQGFISLSAAMLAKLSPGTTLTALSGCRIVVLPAEPPALPTSDKDVSMPAS